MWQSYFTSGKYCCSFLLVLYFCLTLYLLYVILCFILVVSFCLFCFQQTGFSKSHQISRDLTGLLTFLLNAFPKVILDCLKCSNHLAISFCNDSHKGWPSLLICILKIFCFQHILVLIILLMKVINDITTWSGAHSSRRGLNCVINTLQSETRTIFGPSP